MMESLRSKSMQWEHRCPLLFYAFFIKRKGACIVQNATQLRTVQPEIRVCIASSGECSLKLLASRVEDWAIEVWGVQFFLHTPEIFLFSNLQSSDPTYTLCSRRLQAHWDPRGLGLLSWFGPGSAHFFFFFIDSGLIGSGLLRELIGVGLRPGRALVKKLQILSDWGHEGLENV